MNKFRSGPRNFFRLFLMEVLLKEKYGARRALDAGSGDGSLTIKLAAKGYTVYAIDTDKNPCFILEERIKALNLKDRINVHCSPLEELSFPKGYFDIIVCGEVLEHLDNDLCVLKKFSQFLKKDGILVFSVPLKGKGWDVWDSITGHKRLYDFKDLSYLLESVGFKIVKSFSWGYPFMKLYHKFVFLRWANKLNSESEIREEKLISTRMGKNSILSFIVGWLFLVDIVFTPKKWGMGIVVKAKLI